MKFQKSNNIVPQISILTSIYNEPENYIREFVESILNQSFRNFELIVIIDNPQRTDAKLILESYTDSRLKIYLNETNIGLALSMNRAAQLASANIYARMDADDVANLDRLEKEYNILKTGDYDFVFSGYDYINEDSHIIRTCNNIFYSTSELTKQLHFKHIIHHPTVMFTRRIFEKVEGYRNFPCTQDLDLWFRMLESGCRFYMISESLLKYRVNSNSVSAKRWFLQKLTGNYIFELSLERILHGMDSYSWENYQKYLNENGINNKHASNCLRRSQHYLYLASITNNRIKGLFLRYLAFLTSGISRTHYLCVLRKRRALNL